MNIHQGHPSGTYIECLMDTRAPSMGVGMLTPSMHVSLAGFDPHKKKAKRAPSKSFCLAYVVLTCSKVWPHVTPSIIEAVAGLLCTMQHVLRLCACMQNCTQSC
eukprot:1161699-Pelagomonas_calceolata.AAC.7